MEAGLSASLRRLEMVRDPMGSPVSMYSRTIELRISRCRVGSGVSDLIDFNYTPSTHDLNRRPVKRSMRRS
jgi:hypothetical protein